MTIKTASSNRRASLALYFACLASLGSLSAASEPALERFEATQPHMGTSFTIILYAPTKNAAEKGFAAAYVRIQALDERLSDYKPESELSLLSAAAPTREPVQLSEDLFRVLTEAQEFSVDTDGAFDVTVGPLTKLWRRARRQKQLPEPKALEAALAAVGYKHLRLDPRAKTAMLERPNMRLDLGGIGQGFAADEALSELRKLGLTRALVNASGDIVAGDAPPGETGWRIGIAPLAPEESPSRFVRLANRAVSTSGDAFQFIEVDGRRYSHIVNPRTGLGLTDQMSVTIIAPNCTTADALATAVCILGPEKGLQLVERKKEVSGMFVMIHQEQVKTKTSRSFEIHEVRD